MVEQSVQSVLKKRVIVITHPFFSRHRGAPQLADHAANLQKLIEMVRPDSHTLLIVSTNDSPGTSKEFDRFISRRGSVPVDRVVMTHSFFGWDQSSLKKAARHSFADSVDLLFYGDHIERCASYDAGQVAAFLHRRGVDIRRIVPLGGNPLDPVAPPLETEMRSQFKSGLAARFRHSDAHIVDSIYEKLAPRLRPIKAFKELHAKGRKAPTKA